MKDNTQLQKATEVTKNKQRVVYNSGNNEWYTPEEYIVCARKVMGCIDLDPASSEIANRTVQAEMYYSKEDDGLQHKWYGNVWLNPPYGRKPIVQFVDKLIHELPNIKNAIVLVNNATETKWFGKMVAHASAVCFPNHRVRFYAPDGKIAHPLQGQALLYIGNHVEEFCTAFGDKGWCALIWKPEGDDYIEKR